jgi:hypothetical protein
VVRNGWQIDDLKIGESPASVTLSPPTEIGRNHVSLAWTASADPDFSAYVVLRSRTPSFDWRSSVEVVAIPDPLTSSYTDITTAPKTSYYYRIMVLTSDSLH